MKCFAFGLATLLAVASALGAAERSLVIDPAQSRVEIFVKSTLESFTARLVDYDATIKIDPERRQATSATFAFRFEDIKTGKDKRDKDMHAWQNTPTYPEGRFVLASLEDKGGGELTARGALTFHGVSRELAFPVVIASDKDRYLIDGEAHLDTRDFGLPIIRQFVLLKVDPHVVVRFHLQGALDQ